MRSTHRIRTIYAKELTDILRDRRTLIAMIVVPIVLYPLLMLGSIQAVSFQTAAIEKEKLFIGVLNEEHKRALLWLIKTDEAFLARQNAQAHPDSEEETQKPEPFEDIEIAVLGTREAIKEHIAERTIHAGVIFDSATIIDAPAVQNTIEFLTDKEDIRSAHAVRRLQDLVRRTQDRLVDARKRRHHLPASFDKPFLVRVTDLSAPQSILGQILPLILILMTITGAIYPAIDLTAGERERGTLETLMVCPVPVIDLVVGKFLVVTTVAIMGAALNLASVTATVYFGGFDKIIASTGGSIPFGKMALILLCLIPFAVLMSAIMMAVCSYARTFKEAQNYVTPVILAVLIPGGIAALPATKLEGIMLVMPVGNMVLLARDFLLGAAVPVWQIAMVLLSTSLYAAAAVAVAANVFGQEAVVFADSGSLRSALSRATFKPSPLPKVSMGLLVVALLFPVWFMVQSAFSPGPDEDASHLLHWTGLLMPLLFVLVPAALLLFWKIDVPRSFALGSAAPRYLVGGALIGLSAWVPAYEVNILQARLIGVPQAVLGGAEILERTLTSMPWVSVFLLIAIIPSICEELLFRGFLLGSLGTAAGKWTAILFSAAIFGVFHFWVFKFVVTAGLGVVLAYLCWQSRSILPGIVMHLLHNAIGVYSVLNPEWFARIGISQDDEWVHLPPAVLVIGGLLFVSGLWVFSRSEASGHQEPIPAVVDV